MAERAASALRTAARRVAAALRDVYAGATGADDYAVFVRHLAAHHPERDPPSRAEFARAQLTERWEGVRRCC